MAPMRARRSAADDAADAQELQQLAPELVGGDVHGVRVRQAERDAVLAQVVADGDLAAERVAPPRHVQLIEIVRIRLHEHRHVEPGELEGVGHALLVAEVRQTDEHAFDAIAVPAEQIGARLGVLPGLDGAELRRLLVEQHAFDVERRAEREQVAASLADELVGKEVPIADDDCKRGAGHRLTCLYFRAKTPNASALAGVTSSQSIDCFSGWPVEPVVINWCA